MSLRPRASRCAWGWKPAGTRAGSSDCWASCRFELWIGDAAEIRTKRVRKQKTDRQDAQLILKLMLKDDFPQIWVPSWENRDLRQLLWHRHRMVQARTRMAGLRGPDQARRMLVLLPLVGCSAPFSARAERPPAWFAVVVAVDRARRPGRGGSAAAPRRDDGDRGCRRSVPGPCERRRDGASRAWRARCHRHCRCGVRTDDAGRGLRRRVAEGVAAHGLARRRELDRGERTAAAGLDCALTAAPDEWMREVAVPQVRFGASSSIRCPRVRPA